MLIQGRRMLASCVTRHIKYKGNEIIHLFQASLDFLHLFSAEVKHCIVSNSNATACCWAEVYILTYRQRSISELKQMGPPPRSSSSPFLQLLYFCYRSDWTQIGRLQTIGLNPTDFALLPSLHCQNLKTRQPPSSSAIQTKLKSSARPFALRLRSLGFPFCCFAGVVVLSSSTSLSAGRYSVPHSHWCRFVLHNKCFTFLIKWWTEYKGTGQIS